MIEVNNLSCGYSTTPVLENLTLAARPGEILALLGPNGSGKTTLLRAMGRLLKPYSGEVLYHGKEIWSQQAREFSSRISLTPQNERRDWPLTVEESIRLGRAPHRGWLLPFNSEDQQNVEQALETTGLAALRHRPITELSGGEWRRMILARALAQQAEAMLLDEPIAGLDLKYQTRMLKLIQHLTRTQALTVVLTLHDLNQAALYADRIALINNRFLVTIGSPEEVLTKKWISETYEIPVEVTRHPVYGTPLIVPLMEKDS